LTTRQFYDIIHTIQNDWWDSGVATIGRLTDLTTSFCFFTCKEELKMRKKTHEEYVAEVSKLHPHIEVVEQYVNNSTMILHRCTIDGCEWSPKPTNVLSGKGCPICGQKLRAFKKTKTHDQYIKLVEQVNQNIEVVGIYAGSVNKIKHRCKIDGHEWYATPNQILAGNGCPLCCRNKLAMLYSKTHDEYVKELAKVRPNIIVLEKYHNGNTKILHRCQKCDYLWYVTPQNLLSHTGCPVCAKKAIGQAPEYKNSIWASQYRDFFSRYMNENQMQTLMPHSNTKINIICPDCNRIKKISPCVLLTHGLGCICGEKRPFPNKFVDNVLRQLNVNIETEYSPIWSGRLRYDVFLSDYNIIIENHGRQHYEECTMTDRTLSEEQANDKYKQELALYNKISEYIVLDCRKSDAQWIRKSIMNSKLPSILNFTDKDIDWIKAMVDTRANSIKHAASMYSDGYSISQISDALHINATTIRDWLKKATELGWCEYIPYRKQSII
jgi:predicted  nucleic acid-binding Zn-ribbon protein